MFYWPALAVDCCATVRRCPLCVPNRIKLNQNVTELQFFLSEAALELVCNDMVGAFIKKTSGGSEYLLVSFDRFTKFVKTVQLNGQSTKEVSKAFNS